MTNETKKIDAYLRLQDRKISLSRTHNHLCCRAQDYWSRNDETNVDISEADAINIIAFLKECYPNIK